MNLDIDKIIGTATFDGTEDSVKEFIPKDLYSVNVSAQQLLVRNPKANTVYTGKQGDVVLKDCYESFFILTPQAYNELLEGQMTQDTKTQS